MFLQAFTNIIFATFVVTVPATLPVDQRTQAGLFLSKLSFNKPFTTVQDQIQLLQKRGLVVSNANLLAHFLTHVGYYRLAGYWQIFQNDGIKHSFVPGTNFDEIVELYSFDRELRLLLLDAIERIEISFRAVLVNQMCESYGPNWFSNSALTFNKSQNNNLAQTIKDELSRSKEEFVKHHRSKYGMDRLPPAWKTLQVLSFGTFSKIYGNIKEELPEKQKVAQIYGLPSDAWMHSWVQVLSVLRNYCAHHSRICYRIFSYPPKALSRASLPWIQQYPSTVGKQNQQVYYQLCAVRYLLHTASADTFFATNL